MNVKFKIKVKDYSITPPNLLIGKVLKQDIEIDLRRVALAIARDQRSYYNSSLLFQQYNKIDKGLYDPIFQNLKNIFTQDQFATLRFNQIPFLKDWKRIMSYSLGTGFGRVALEEYLDVVWSDNIDYYSDIYTYLNKYRESIFKHAVVKSTKVKGDAPDLLCLLTNGDICLAELKGQMYDSISDALLDSWKQQFSRVNLSTTDGSTVSNINHICATRFKVDEQSKRIFSKIYFCDPPKIIKGNPENSDIPFTKISKEHIVISHYIRSCHAFGFRFITRLLSIRLLNGEKIILPKSLIENEIKLIDVPGENRKVVIPKQSLIPNNCISNDDHIVGLDLEVFLCLRAYISGDFIFNKFTQSTSAIHRLENPNIINSKDGFYVIPRNLIEK